MVNSSIGTELNSKTQENFSYTVLTESYTFPISADDSSANANYTIQKGGLACIQYVFSNMKYSQFWLEINGVRYFERSISSGNQNLNKTTGQIVFPVKPGDTISVKFYSAYTMDYIKMKVFSR